MTEYTKEGVKVIGEATRAAVDEIVETGKHIDEKIVRPLEEAVGGYVEARDQQAAAERDARIMERAVELKRDHPNIPADKALEHARNEENAGLLGGG